MSSNNVTSSATGESNSNRMRAWVAAIPLITRITIAVNLCIYVYAPLVNPLPRGVAICPWMVTYYHHYEIIITSAFFHGGFFHVFFNMMTAFFVMNILEPKFGSLATLGQIILFTILDGSLYILIYVIGTYFTTNPVWVPCSIGFSGVLFSQVMTEVSVLPAGTRRSLFGFCVVPAWIYPYVLLVLLSLMFQNVSFWGHLSGLVVGLVYSKGFLNFLTLKRSWIIAFEEKEWMQWLVSSDIYHRCPQDSLLPDPFEGRCAVPEAVSSCFGRIRSSASEIRERRTTQRQIQRQQRNDYARVANTEDDSDIELGTHSLLVEEDPQVAGTPSAPPLEAALPNADEQLMADQSTVSSKTKQGRTAPAKPQRHHQSRLLQGFK